MQHDKQDSQDHPDKYHSKGDLNFLSSGWLKVQCVQFGLIYESVLVKASFTAHKYNKSVQLLHNKSHLVFQLRHVHISQEPWFGQAICPTARLVIRVNAHVLK